MLTNQHLFVTSQGYEKPSFMLLKLDWENGYFQLECEVVTNLIRFVCDWPTFKSNDYLIVPMESFDHVKYCFVKVDLNVCKIEKYREITIPWIDTLCHTIFENKLLFFQHHNREREHNPPGQNSSISLCCLNLKDEKLDKFDIKLPYGFEEVWFRVTSALFIIILDTKMEHVWYLGEK
jgi:hypothetical protein